jgi:molecular chaperone DnaJ
MSKDYYEILGVGKEASAEEIKKAYRRLAHQHHPDKQGGNEQKFKEINEAYQVLGSAEKRKQYDQFGQSFSGTGPGGMNWQDFAKANAQGGFDFSQGFGNTNFDFGDASDIEDLFSGIFGGGSARRRSDRRSRARDLEVELTLDFEEAVFGVNKKIVIEKNVICKQCEGVGAKKGSKVEMCSHCKGAGYIETVVRSFFGMVRQQQVCPACQGEGQTYAEKCATCQGAGIIRSREEITIEVPAGADNGTTLKLSGQGEAAGKSGKPGDLYIHLRVRPSKKFTRHGADIHGQLMINFTQAALGDKILIETLDGQVSLKIPSGISSGTVLKLSGQGVPHLNRRGRGDHLVKIIIDIPKNLSRKQKKILEELQAEGL